MTGLGLSQGQVLTGSSFATNRGTKNGGVLSVWSRSAQSRFHGREGLLALNGDVVTSTVGADYAKERMVRTLTEITLLCAERPKPQKTGSAWMHLATLYRSLS